MKANERSRLKWPHEIYTSKRGDLDLRPRKPLMKYDLEGDKEVIWRFYGWKTSKDRFKNVLKTPKPQSREQTGKGKSYLWASITGICHIAPYAFRGPCALIFNSLQSTLLWKAKVAPDLLKLWKVTCDGGRFKFFNTIFKLLLTWLSVIGTHVPSEDLVWFGTMESFWYAEWF